jgi:hypothetical protein
MRIDARPRKRNSPRPVEKSAPGFLQWLRGRDCFIATHGRAGSSIACGGKIEAAHVDYAGDKGVGTKVSDRFSIPLCSFHHRLQHDKGWQTFEGKFLGTVGMAKAAAEAFWKAWPGRGAWERKLER